MDFMLGSRGELKWYISSHARPCIQSVGVLVKLGSVDENEKKLWAKRNAPFPVSMSSCPCHVKTVEL